MTIHIYRNKRNSNKCLEIHCDGYGHWAIRQYMEWPGIKNPTGDGILHRWKKAAFLDLISDYEYSSSTEKRRA